MRTGCAWRPGARSLAWPYGWHAARLPRACVIIVHMNTVNENIMNLHINGERRKVAAGLTVSALLEELGMAERRVALERNGELVPKSLHDKTRLDEGDKIEIVHAIGGG